MTPLPPPAQLLPGPTPLEVASGVVMGGDATARLPETHLHPRAAFDAALLDALQRPPCVVSFSGGRDSSAVLAAAVVVAHRESLPAPVALSQRFPGDPAAEESEWQEQVIRFTGVQDWERVDMVDVDLLGHSGREELGRLGLVYPANAFVHAPIAERAAGGTLVTGVGGDEAMTASARWVRLNRVMAGQARPGRRVLKDAAAAFLPASLRKVAVRRREHFDPVVPWLRPEPARAIRRQWEKEVFGSPVRFDRLIEAFYGSRSRKLGLQTLDVLARSRDARSVHPFGDARFLSAMARHYSRVGPLSRGHAMHDLFADVLPAEVLQRRGKASFNKAFWGPRTRSFVAGWDGRGVDSSLVDVDALTRIWRGPADDYRSYMLLQLAWLSSRSTGSGQ
jgi:hypothetical protein